MKMTKYDDSEGVWRTIGGRRVFIRKGQSLSDAMIESGKFKNLRSDYKKAKEEETKEKEAGEKLNQEKTDTKKAYEEYKKNYDYEKEMPAGARFSKMLDESGVKSFGDEIEEQERLDIAKDIAKEIYGLNENNASNERIEKEARKILEFSDGEVLDKGDTPFTNSKGQLERSTKSLKEWRDSLKKDTNKYASAEHIGFGDYNKDGIPVYDNKIDYTGDFGRADLSTLSNEELTTALNKQSELYNKAVNEQLGDQRTRNGKMNKIFNTARQQQYENGMNKLNEEIQKRDLPRYNIQADNGQIMVSSPTKEMAQRQLNDMLERDKQLQKEYGWGELPKYTIKEGKVDDQLNERKEETFTAQSTNPFYDDTTYSKEQLDKMAENKIKPMKNTYSGRGWEGTNYDSNLSTKDIAKNISDYSKKEFPDVKLSRRTDYNSMDINIMSSKQDLYASTNDIDKMNDRQIFDTIQSSIGGNVRFDDWLNENNKKSANGTYTAKEAREYLKQELNTYKSRKGDRVTGDEWYLSDYGKKVVSGLNKEMNSYNFDDDDPMTDYFHSNFYGYVYIGKWDKPYAVKETTTNSKMNDAIRQKAFQKYKKEHPGTEKTLEDFM